jgi:hypothetical protein
VRADNHRYASCVDSRCTRRVTAGESGPSGALFDRAAQDEREPAVQLLSPGSRSVGSITLWYRPALVTSGSGRAVGLFSTPGQPARPGPQGDRRRDPERVAVTGERPEARMGP